MGVLLRKVLRSKFGKAILRSYAKGVTKRLLPGNKVLTVEFIGAPGVGKSTIHNRLLQSRKSDENWVSKSEFLKVIDLVKLEDSLHLEYEKLLEIKIDNIFSSKEFGLNKYKQIIIALDRIQSDISIKNASFRANVVADESLMLHFGSSLERMFNLYPSEVSKLIHGRALIYCLSSPERVVKNINKRKHHGKIWHRHAGLSDIELLALSKEIITIQSHWINFVKGLGVPVLEVDTEEEIGTNLNKIKRFMKDFYNCSKY